MQRADIVLPFIQRPEPPLKPMGKFDPFAPANGKPLAMVITSQKFIPQMGRNDVIYVNLGNSQGRQGWRLFPNLPLHRHRA